MTCILCGSPVRRRWWQRGLLAPMPLCQKGVAPECRAILDTRLGSR